MWQYSEMMRQRNYIAASSVQENTPLFLLQESRANAVETRDAAVNYSRYRECRQLFVSFDTTDVTYILHYVTSLMEAWPLPVVLTI